MLQILEENEFCDILSICHTQMSWKFRNVRQLLYSSNSKCKTQVRNDECRLLEKFSFGKSDKGNRPLILQTEDHGQRLIHWSTQQPDKKWRKLKGVKGKE